MAKFEELDYALTRGHECSIHTIKTTQDEYGRYIILARAYVNDDTVKGKRELIEKHIKLFVNAPELFNALKHIYDNIDKLDKESVETICYSALLSAQ